MQQLHRELRFIDDSKQGKQLSITQDGVHALEQFVLAKYYLTAQVYSHRVRLITDQMIIRAIKLGIEEDSLPELTRLYRYDGSNQFVKNYVKWDDSRFLLTFGDPSCPGKHCHEIVSRLRSRSLLKQVFDSEVGELPECSREVIRDITKPRNRELRRDLERRIAAVIQNAGFRLVTSCDDPSHLVIAHAYTLKSVRVQSRDDEGPILVRKGSRTMTFEEASVLFTSINEKMVRPQFAIYAPVRYDNPAERRNMQNKLREPILECLTTFGDGVTNA
jgi:HD superfamily phosphohydrolase